MKLSRREFLGLSGATAGGLVLPCGVVAVALADGIPLHKPIGETPTICPFCAVGCGAIVATQGDRVVNIEGDPDHPVNLGSLCSKGMALAQLNTVDGEVNRNRNRLILSERAAAREYRERRKERLINGLEIGSIRKGRVISLTDFGAFVDLGGADVLIHLTELSWKRVATWMRP